MTEPFLIDDERLRTLSATRQGRVSVAGYNYQSAYAVARLAAMSVRQPVLDLQDWPQRLRYDWGEDLDEACDGGKVIFTQCKRVATIGQPAALADVMQGFAAKWLWVSQSERGRLRFRLVCSDPRFASGGAPPDSLKSDARVHFLNGLKQPAGQHSDRAAWIADAKAFGHEELFEALWGLFECLYLPADVVDSEPAGPRLSAEKEALRVLLERGQIDSHGQTQVLGRLRRLIHDNLITFDPTNQSIPPSFDRGPRRIDRADVNAAIDPWRPATQRQPPFQLVDRTFLSEQRELEREQFVARQPDWCDVAHGHDETIKFIERDQTEDLELAVLEKVVARIGRAGKLPTLFVVGAPGDGKTTITRRVAARLVDKGRLLIADTGVGLHEPPGEPDEYVQAVERLQSFGRSVVLLLDDPLYAESPWIDVLKKLNRPGLQVGVLVASPQFLFDEHKRQLQRVCDVETFGMARTSQQERESLAALYGRPVSSEAEEDFLVVAMVTAAGVPFREIIDRLWLTLADGRDLSSARSLSDLPWQTRAYLFVSFFSRAYEACPEPLLLKLLEMTGGLSDTSDVRAELQRMRHFGGWRIFRIGQRARASLDFQGAPITAAHTVIARQAWEQRPLPWCDVNDAIIEAAVRIPESIHDVTYLGIRLKSSSFARSESGNVDSAFTRKFVERCQQESGIETRHVSCLSRLALLGDDALINSVIGLLLDRARPDSQGWLAALGLWFLQRDVGRELKDYTEVDLLSLIQVADFSIAPGRASQFGKVVSPTKLLLNAFVSRLLDALDGKLTWNLNGTLLTYLLKIAKPTELSSRLPQIRLWLERHPHVTDARGMYLYLLRQAPAKSSDLRADTLQITRWLEEHGDDTRVRGEYLTLLEHHTQVEFSDLRADAARYTAKWLTDHPDDYEVRRRFLSFLKRFPAEFSDLRADAARQTSKWLADHPDDAEVRRQFMVFLSALRPVGEWQRLASEALSGAAELTVRSDWARQHATLITSFLRLHLALLKSLKAHDSEAARKALQFSHDVAAEWCARNASAGLQYDLPLP